MAELPVGPALLQAVLEVVDRRSGTREHLPHRRQLGRLGVMRRAGDRDLVVVEVVVALDERNRLDRLRRRAQKEAQVVAPPLAAGRRDVDAMHRLDDVAAPHGYPDCVHRRSVVVAGTARGRSLAAQLDPLVKRSPIERAGPAHIATLKTIEPPLSVLDGAAFAGVERRAKRFLLPTDDEELVVMVHLMSAGRLKYVAPDGKGAKTPMFRVRFADGGELQLTEAGSKKRAGVWLLDREALQAELAHLGPEADRLTTDDVARILASDSRRLHSLLRDQRLIAGIGRAWANEILWAARLSPYSLSTQVDAAETERLAAAIHDELARGLELRLAGANDDEDLPGAQQARRAVRPLRHADRARRLRGAHDLLLPAVPDRGPGAEGPAPVAAAQVGDGHDATLRLRASQDGTWYLRTR